MSTNNNNNQTQTQTLDEYDQLLAEVRAAKVGFQRRQCKKVVPRMFYALTTIRHMSTEDSRLLVERDMVAEGFAIETVRKYLPREAKDQTKSAAGTAGAEAQHENERIAKGIQEILGAFSVHISELTNMVNVAVTSEDGYVLIKHTRKQPEEYRGVVARKPKSES